MAAAATMTSAGGLLAMLNEDQPALKLHQLTSMTTDDIVRASRLLDNEIRILKEELQRTSLESDSFKEKIKENQEKIKLNKQLPYLVGNIVEILEMNPEEEAEEDGANIDLDSQRKDLHCQCLRNTLSPYSQMSHLPSSSVELASSEKQGQPFR